MKSKMCSLIASTLLLAMHPTDARKKLRSNVQQDGFDVVGSTPLYQGELTGMDGGEDFTRSKLQKKRRTTKLKEYARDESMATVDSITINDHNRFERQCQDDERNFGFEFVTDNYGYETSWTLEIEGNAGSWDVIESGPPGQSNYEDNMFYRGAYCLAVDNNYRVTIHDLFSDGFCCSYGMGTYKYSIDNVVQFDSNYMRTFENSASHEFFLEPPDSQSNQFQGRGPSSICGANAEQIRIQISADRYGEETSWDLVDSSSNEIIQQAAVGTYGEFSTDDVAICVPDGTYVFTIRDGIGDGMCCADGEGFYKLFKDDELMVHGGDFNSGTHRSHTIIVGYYKTLRMTQREQEYLNAHNSRRLKNHEAMGVSYVPLKYSSGLAEHAASWANELLNDCDIIGIEHEHGVEQGENLAKNVGSGNWGQQYPVENIVRRWVEREETWDYPANAHLTQALWRSSRYLGCAEASKVMNENSGAVCRIQVCRYARAGNCNMGFYNSSEGENWKIPMLMEVNKCGPACPPEGCF